MHVSAVAIEDSFVSTKCTFGRNAESLARPVGCKIILHISGTDTLYIGPAVVAYCDCKTSGLLR